MTLEYLKRQTAPNLAYYLTQPAAGNKQTPIVFLGGFRSDMQGTKALFLEDFCKKSGRPFLRFDYSGHGQSHGQFENFCVSDWVHDSKDMMKHHFDTPALLIGSSMGGWIGLILAQKEPEMLAGFIGLAAAPDFTQWIEEGMDEDQKQTLKHQGHFNLENDYGDAYTITKKLLDDGRKNKILDKSIKTSFPIHLIQGKKDADVPWQTAQKIKETLSTSTVDITYIDEGDHRLSAPQELEVLSDIIQTII